MSKWIIGGALIGAVLGATNGTGVIGTAATCAVLGFIAGLVVNIVRRFFD